MAISNSLLLFALFLSAEGIADKRKVEAPKPEPKYITGAKTVVLKVPIDEALREKIEKMLAGDETISVSLSLWNLLPIENNGRGVAGVEAFLQKEDAKRSTGIHSPHWVGAVAFYLPDKEKGSSFIMGLNETLKKLYPEKKLKADELTVTLVLMPMQGRATGWERVKVGGATVEAKTPER